MRERTATHQLLLSDAVDRAVSHIDFSPLAGEEVFLDSQYLVGSKNLDLVNTPYIVSSIRQQMLADGCLLTEDAESAEYIVEARVGALGMDAHDVNYGIPQNNVLSTAAVALPGAGALPPIPEISLARKTEDSAAAKIALFAYRRETREPVWQSGVSVAKSRARGKWILGVGPIQDGSIYSGPMFAGERLKATPFADDKRTTEEKQAKQEQDYRSAAIFDPQLQRNAEAGEGGASSTRLTRLPDDAGPAEGPTDGGASEKR